MPYKQGELDGLCGVYAIVNALEAGLDSCDATEAKDLFHYLTDYLARQGRLQTIIREGMWIRELCRLIDHAILRLQREQGLRLTRRLAFARHVSLSRYWRRLGDHLASPGHAAIVGLWGVHRQSSQLKPQTPPIAHFAWYNYACNQLIL